MKRWTQKQVPVTGGYSHPKRYYHEPVACHQEHEINVALVGEGIYQLGDETVNLTAGKILLIPAGVEHAVEVKKELCIAMIHFHPEVFDGVIVKSHNESSVLNRLKTWENPLPSRAVIDPEAHDTIERLAESIMIESNRNDVARNPLLNAMAIQAAIYFLRLMAEPENPHASDEMVRRILTVQRWIDSNFAKASDINQLADKAHLAPTYFANQFRKVVGVPPMKYVREQRILQAKRLLERTDHPAKVVGWSVGYSDVSHFNHVFKQVTGISPLAYRRECEQKGSDPKSD